MNKWTINNRFFSQSCLIVVVFLCLAISAPVAAQQYARPDATTDAAGWSAIVAATHHEAVNEVTVDDTDYIDSTAGNNSTIILSLSNVIDPLSYSNNHILRYRCRSSGGGGGPERCNVALFEGATEIANNGNVTAIRNTFTLEEFVITDASGITDYSNLNIHISSVSLGGGESIHISWAELEVPTASATPPTVDTLTLATVLSDRATLGATSAGTSITDRGTVWRYTTGVTIGDNKLQSGTGEGAFSHERTGMTTATQVFYKGYATNTGGTTLSTEGSFYTEPATQATAATFPVVGANSMTISWTASAEPGAGSIVVVSEASGLTAPLDGSTYTADTVFASGSITAAGDYVVYNGTGNSVAITGLTATTTYYVAVYSWSGTGSGSAGVRYLQTTPATGSQLTDTPAAPPTVDTLTLSTVLSDRATLGASSAGTSITDRGTVWRYTTGVTIGDNKLQSGTGEGAFFHERTGMNSATQVFYKGYAINSGGTTLSSEGSFYTEPATQATTVTFPVVATDSMTISWTASAEPGAGSIVVVSETAGVVAPSDGTTHTASSVFASGSTTAAGDYVVYNSTGNSVAITGLTENNTYYVSVYSYSGTGAGITGVRYLETSPATGSQVAAALPTIDTLTLSTVLSDRATLGATSAGTGITDRGTVWRYTTGVTIADSKLQSGSGEGPFSHIRTSMNSATQVFYKGYATNSIGTALSTEGSFYTEPATQATTVTFPVVATDSMTISWTASAEPGAGSIVVVSDVAGVVAPSDGSTYTASSVFASGSTTAAGDYVVYNSTGNSVAITGLTENNTYYVSVYSYSGTGAGITGVRYLETSPATGSQVAAALPTIDTLTLSTVLSDRATLGATSAGTGITDRGTVWRYTTGVTIADNKLQSGTGEGVFFHERTGMTSATQVFYKGYATNSIGTALSTEGSFYTEPATQATNVTFPVVGATGLTISWTASAEGGAGSIVVVSESSGITAPADETSYSANTVFASGSTTAAGDYVVYNSTGNSVAITGLSEDTTYYVAVYTYSGTGSGPSGVRYLQATPATGNQLTDTSSDEPTIQASSIVIEVVASTSLRFSWTAGNGDGSIATMRLQATSEVTPVDFTDYTADSGFTLAPETSGGSGNFVVYKGTGSSVTVSGLTNSTTYTITVYAWGGAGAATDYLLTTPPSANQITDGPAMHNYDNAAVCADCHSNHGNSGLVPRGTNQTDVCTAACHNATGPASGKLNFALHLTPTYGDVDPDCGSCHEIHRINVGSDNTTESTNPVTTDTAHNRSFIRANVDKYITTATPDDAVYHTLADDLAIEGGDATTSRGICQSCHTLTDYHKSTGGTVASQCHKGGASDTCSGEVECTSCHIHSDNFKGAGGDCTACHSSTQDNGTLAGRREIVSEFALLSTHIADTSLTAVDCEVCHQQVSSSPAHEHQDESVTLWDVDTGADPGYQLFEHADPTSSVTVAATLNNFCLNCHDSNGAAAQDDTGGGDENTPSSPFTGSIQPPDINATWPASSHATISQQAGPDGSGQPTTCVGDGEFGCHGGGHGSAKLDLLAPADGSGTTGSLEGFCLNCHTSNAASSLDINQYFGGLATNFTGDSNNGAGAPINQRHDVLPADQTYSGGVVTCKDCHEPHTATDANPNKDPDTGAMFTNNYATNKSYTDDGFNWTYDSGSNLDPTNPIGGSLYSEPDTIEFCLACHDGTTPPGVTMSPGMLNIATTYQVDYHGRGDAGSAGNGDFKPPWVATVGDEPGTPYAAMNCTVCHDSHGSGNIYHLKESITIGDPANTPQSLGGWTGDTIGELSGTTYTLPLTGGVQTDHDWGGWCSFCHDMQPHKVDEDKACRSGHMHGGGAF